MSAYRHTGLLLPRVAALTVVLLMGAAWSAVTMVPAASLLPDAQAQNFDTAMVGLISGSSPVFTSIGITLCTVIPPMVVGGDTLSAGSSVTGGVLVSQSSQLAIGIVGSPLDNQGAGGGFGMTLSTPCTQVGYLLADQINHGMRVEVFSGGISQGFFAYTRSGAAFPNPFELFESTVPFDEVRITSPSGAGGWGLDDLTFAGFVGPSCAITSPAPGASVTTAVLIGYDVDHATGLPLTATFEFSTNGGMLFAPCTAGGASVNPAVGLPTPSSQSFEWNSIADSVALSMIQATVIRITVLDGTQMATCTVMVDVDNRAPTPTCTLALAAPSPSSGSVDFDLMPDSLNGPTVDALLEFSTDTGITWVAATAGGTSTNPLIGLPIATPVTFTWDSRADMIGLAAPVTGVVMRATVDDGFAPVSGVCLTAPFDVDNTSLCPGLCGDCDLNAIAPTIIDALTAAQISAGLIVPSLAQTGCCDVDSSSAISVLDALLMAQSAAGLPATLVCP